MAAESMFHYAERATQEPGLAHELRSRFHNSDRHRVAFGDSASRQHLADFSKSLNHLPIMNKQYPGPITQENTLEAFINNVNIMRSLGMSDQEIQHYINTFETRCECPRKRLHNGNTMKNCTCF